LLQPLLQILPLPLNTLLLPVVVAGLLGTPVAAVVLVDTEPQLDIRLLLQRPTRQLLALVVHRGSLDLHLVGIPARSVAEQPFSLPVVVVELLAGRVMEPLEDLGRGHKVTGGPER
jgi:hypothetical protein